METDLASPFFDRGTWVRRSWLLACVGGALCSLFCSLAIAQGAPAGADRLRATYGEMGDKLGGSVFRYTWNPARTVAGFPATSTRA